jgi:hypothetical protein
LNEINADAKIPSIRRLETTYMPSVRASTDQDARLLHRQSVEVLLCLCRYKKRKKEKKSKQRKRTFNPLP